jgi:hypothetical protein
MAGAVLGAPYNDVLDKRAFPARFDGPTRGGENLESTEYCGENLEFVSIRSSVMHWELGQGSVILWVEHGHLSCASAGTGIRRENKTAGSFPVRAHPIDWF